MARKGSKEQPKGIVGLGKSPLKFVMKSTDNKLSRNLTIPNELGLHARAAAKIARLAEEARGKVLIVKDSREVDGTDILDILSLYCPRGAEVTVKITDRGDAKVLDSITRLIEEGFGEP